MLNDIVCRNDVALCQGPTQNRWLATQVALTLTGMDASVEFGHPAAVLDALRKAGRCGGPLPESYRELMRAARLSGVSWNQIGDAVGLTGAQARNRFVRSSPAASVSPASAAGSLGDEELMALAVSESKAVRRQHVNR